MLKNWTVKAKTINNKAKGVHNRASYLLDKHRSSHCYNKIIPLVNIANNKANILSAIQQDQDLRVSNKGLSSYAVEFSFNLPQDIPQPTPEQWRVICKDMMLSLSESLNKERIKSIYTDSNGNTRSKTTGWNDCDYFTPKQLSNVCLAVAHNSDNSGNYTGPNHLHLTVGKVCNGHRLLELSRKQVLSNLKNDFNRSILNHLKVDNKTYKPLNQNARNKPLFLARQHKLLQTIKNRENVALNKLGELMATFNQTIKDFIKLSLKQEAVEIQAKKAAEVIDFIQSIPHKPSQKKLISQARETAEEIESLVLHEAIDEVVKTTTKPKRRRRRRVRTP